MSRVTKAEREDYAARLREHLRAAGPDGKATLHIQWASGGPTSSGRTDRYEVRLWESGDNGRPWPTLWLTRMVAYALGYRYNDRHESVVLTGYGYSKSHQIASDLARLCGHPIHCVAPGEAMFSGGMIG